MDPSDFETLKAKAISIAVGAAEGFGDKVAYVRGQGVCELIRDKRLSGSELSGIFHCVKSASHHELPVTLLRQIFGNEQKQTLQLTRSMRSQLRSICELGRPSAEMVDQLENTWALLLPLLREKQAPLEETFG